MASVVYALSDRFIEQLATLDPGIATALGIPGHDHEMTDFSPAGHDARGQVVRNTLAELNRTEATTDADRLAAGVLRESLELGVIEFDVGDHLRSIRVLRGDVDNARRIFDLMPTATAADYRSLPSACPTFPGVCRYA